jgi:hypothetical protein
MSLALAKLSNSLLFHRPPPPTATLTQQFVLTAAVATHYNAAAAAALPTNKVTAASGKHICSAAIAPAKPAGWIHQAELFH